MATTLAVVIGWDRVKQYFNIDDRRLHSSPCDSLSATQLFNACEALERLVDPVSGSMVSFITNLNIKHINEFKYPKYDLQVSGGETESFKTISLHDITSLAITDSTKFSLILKEESNLYNELPEIQASRINMMYSALPANHRLQESSEKGIWQWEGMTAYQFSEVLMGVAVFLDQLSPEQRNHLFPMQPQFAQIIFRSLIEQFLSMQGGIMHNSCDTGYNRDSAHEVLILNDFVKKPFLQWFANCNPVEAQL